MFSRLSLAMPIQHLIDTYRNFGFGTNTGLGLTGESSGLLPQRKFWSQLDRATFAFGYGLMVTPFNWPMSTPPLAGMGLSARSITLHRPAGDRPQSHARKDCP